MRKLRKKEETYFELNEITGSREYGFINKINVKSIAVHTNSSYWLLNSNFELENTQYSTRKKLIETYSRSKDYKDVFEFDTKSEALNWLVE